MYAFAGIRSWNCAKHIGRHHDRNIYIPMNSETALNSLFCLTRN